MALTKKFIKKHVPFEGDKSIFEYSQFTPKNLSHMKQEPVVESPTDLKRKREDESALPTPVPEIASAENCKPPERSLVMEKDHELLANFGNNSSFSNVKASKILQSFTKKSQSQGPQTCLSLLKSMITLLYFNLTQWKNYFLHKVLTHLSKWTLLSLFKQISPFPQGSLIRLPWRKGLLSTMKDQPKGLKLRNIVARHTMI